MQIVRKFHTDTIRLIQEEKGGLWSRPLFSAIDQYINRPSHMPSTQYPSNVVTGESPKTGRKWPAPSGPCIANFGRWRSLRSNENGENGSNLEQERASHHPQQSGLEIISSSIMATASARILGGFLLVRGRWAARQLVRYAARRAGLAGPVVLRAGPLRSELALISLNARTGRSGRVESSE